MATATSNLSDVAAALAGLAHAVDFTVGTGTVLAKDCVELVVSGVRDRTVVRQEQPDGGALADNAPAYKATKGGRPVSIGPDRKGRPSGGDMMSEVNLRGEVTIEPDAVTIAYGASALARRKIQWFTNGSSGSDGEPSGAKNQPPRPTYALNPDIEAAIDHRIDEHIDAILGAP